MSAKHNGIPTSKNVTSSIQSFSNTVARHYDILCLDTVNLTNETSHLMLFCHSLPLYLPMTTLVNFPNQKTWSHPLLFSFPPYSITKSYQFFFQKDLVLLPVTATSSL